MARKTIYEKLADKLLKEKGVVIENVRRAGAAFQKKTPSHPPVRGESCF